MATATGVMCTTVEAPRPVARLTPRARRSPTEWGVRGLLAGVISVVGYVAVSHSFAAAIRTKDPVRAHALAPGDGRITATLAETQFSKQPAGATGSSAARLARLALNQDPTAVAAVATLGFQAQLRGEPEEARRLFTYSQQLSRRNLPTQLWAIETDVNRGNIAGALKHYDTALRSSEVAPSILFPVLSAAITEGAIRTGLVTTLSKKPSWTGAFIAHLSGGSADPGALARLLINLRHAGVPITAEADAAAVKGLVARGEVQAAWRYYQTIRRGADPRKSRDPHFSASLSTPTLFDWVASSDPSLAASLQRGPDGGVFDFGAVAGADGILLQQMQFLPAGNYRLIGHSTGIAASQQSLPYWNLTCQDGRELNRVEIPESAQANGVFAGRFTVPASCPVQVLGLIARPTDNAAGTSGQIERVQLEPIQ